MVQLTEEPQIKIPCQFTLKMRRHNSVFYVNSWGACDNLYDIPITFVNKVSFSFNKILLHTFKPPAKKIQNPIQIPFKFK